MIRIPILRPGVYEPFPPVETALDEPDGLLAAGGDLSAERLLDAYRHGIFPWFSAGDPILWWSPDPRMVFATDSIHISRRLRRCLRQCDWTITADRAFAEVMHACIAPRKNQPGTWITPTMFNAYCALHAQGHAHSVEIREGGDLVGGIYGICIGRMFFGESMFSKKTNGSKLALIALAHVLRGWGFPLLDAQVSSAHIASMGAYEMPRHEFTETVSRLCAVSAGIDSWRECWPVSSARDLV